MITVTVFRSDTGTYKGFRCKGHAGFAERGQDVVCAAVSVLVINTVNSIEAFTSQTFTCEHDEDMICLKLTAVPTKETKLLLDSMIFGLQAIQKQYQKQYLRLKFKEV